MKTISKEAVSVLGSMEVDGKLAFITAGQLDRKLYQEVNAALDAIGGHWMRSLKAHAFNDDPRDAIDQVVLAGGFTDKKQEFGFFETPVSLARRMATEAELRDGMRLLEPSAGRGRLIDAAYSTKHSLRVTAVELDPANMAELKKQPMYGELYRADFLAVQPSPNDDERFDRILMNPPFARQADVDHVRHAHRFLRPDGVLLSVMSAGIEFRANRKAEEFREWLAALGGKVVALPDDSFKESGTNVRTVLVTIGDPKTGQRFLR